MTDNEKKVYIEKTSKSRQRECRAYCDYHYANVNYPLTDLNQCYAKPSDAKQNAFTYCIYLCSKLDGFGFHISSYNGYIFTVVFKFMICDKLCYAHITPNYEAFCYADA